MLNIISIPFRLLWLVIKRSSKTTNTSKILAKKKEFISYLNEIEKEIVEKTEKSASAPFIVDLLKLVKDSKSKAQGTFPKLDFFGGWDYSLEGKLMRLNRLESTSKEEIASSIEELKRRASVFILISSAIDNYKKVYEGLENFSHKDMEKIDFSSIIDNYKVTFIDKEKELIEFDYTLELKEAKVWLDQYKKDIEKTILEFKAEVKAVEAKAKLIQKNIDWIEKVKPAVKKLADDDYYEGEKYLETLDEVAEQMKEQMFELNVEENKETYSALRESYDAFNDKASSRILHQKIAKK